jgi:hypothetical protein
LFKRYREIEYVSNHVNPVYPVKKNGENEMSGNVDVLSELAGWIRDYCRHMSKEISMGRQSTGSGATRLHIQQWVDTTLSFVAESTGLPCPSCGDLIPLNLDKKVMTDIIVSLLSDNSVAPWKDIKFIANKIKENADEHQIECKGHNKDCPIAETDCAILSDLLKPLDTH